MAGKKGMKINLVHENSERFAEYWKKHNPTWTDEECETKAKWFKRSCNYQCIEYYEKKYPELSHEEHLKLKQQLQEQKRQNKDTNIEYWKTRFPEKSLEELEELRSKAAKEKNKCNIEYWLHKYPDKSLKEVKEMYQNFYNIWLSHQEGWGKGDKNVNSKKNTSKEIRNSRSPKCIEFYERKYPELTHEEHLKLLNEQYEKTNKSTLNNNSYNTKIEYYLSRGMSYEEAEQALKERQVTFSLNKCIEKYGEIEGLKIFSKRQQKWLKSLQQSFLKNGDGRAPQSEFAIYLIGECCKQLNIRKSLKEKYIYDKKLKTAYAYDFQYNDKIIEFQGDYWHCNPKLYDSTFFNKVKKMTAKEIWEYDKQKKECAEYYGYKVLYIWELEYNENKQKTINKCIEFLTS